MSAKLLFTIIGFNSLFLIFLVAVAVVYIRPQQWSGMLALFLGWLTGFINIETSEVHFPALLLMAFGFFLGYARPKDGWRNAFILSVFVPISQFAWIAATHNFDSIVAEGAGSMTAFVPAFSGIYMGKFIARSHEVKQIAVKASV